MKGKDRAAFFTKRVLFSIIVVTVFFAFCEGTQRMRYYFRYNHPYWLKFGFSPKPLNYLEMQEKELEKRRLKAEVKDIKVSCLYYDGYRKNNPEYNEYTINSFGFRGREFDLKKEDYRIVALGGSTTFCAAVNDDETWPSYLEQKTGFEVINAGVPAMTMREIICLFKKEIVPLQPDMIVINSTLNDLYYYSMQYKPTGLFYKADKWLLQYSLFYLTLRERINIVLGLSCGDVHRAPLKDVIGNLTKDENFWEYFEDSFKEMIKISKQYNIKVVILKQPLWLGKRKQILFDKRMNPIYERIYKIFDLLGVLTIDAVSLFNSHPQKDELYTDDGFHLTKKGNEFLAEIIIRNL